MPGSGKHYTVCQGEPVLNSKPCCGERDRRVEIDNTPLFHQCHCLERRSLTPLLQHSLEHLHYANRRDEQAASALNRRGKEICIWPIREVLEPATGVDDIHTRSSSRGTSVSIPRKKPRIAFAGFTGMNSIRSMYWSAWTSCPGSIPNASRIFRGMTTWYFGETFTTAIDSYRLTISQSIAIPLYDLPENDHCSCARRPLRHSTFIIRPVVTQHTMRYP